MLTRILIVSQAILLVAVALLFYKVYQSPTASTPAAVAAIAAADTAKAPVLPILATGSGGGIFFVNTDTLLARYTTFKAQKAVLEGKGKRLEKEITRRATALQTEVGQAQQKMQSGQLSEAQAQEMDQRLRQRGGELEQYRDEQTANLVEEERKLTDALNTSIQNFLKGFAGRRGYKYVLGYTSAGGILYANDSLDITDAVVAGLNAKK